MLVTLGAQRVKRYARTTMLMHTVKCRVLNIIFKAVQCSDSCSSLVSQQCFKSSDWELKKKLSFQDAKKTGKQDFESLITNASEDLRSGQNFPRSMCFEEPFYTPNIIFSSLPLPHVLHRSQFSEKKRNGKWQPNQMKKNTTLQVNVSSNLLC